MRKFFQLFSFTLIGGFSAQAQMPGTNPGDVGSVSFSYQGAQVTHTTVRAKDGFVWLQQNLGSTRVATANNDTSSYGHLFQWGRWDDGHQLRTSTGVNASLLYPNNPSALGTGDPNFYWNNVMPQWWNHDSTQITDSWSGDSISATNGKDPCVALGVGWRLPDSIFMARMRDAEGITNNATAFSSNLKIPLAGYRNGNGQRNIQGIGSAFLFWTNSNYTARSPWALYNGTMVNYWNRPFASSCRCVFVPLCDGTPEGGKVSSTKQSVCNGDDFKVSLNGASELTNIAYQWQQRPVGSTDFSDIPDANKLFLDVENFQTTTEFRCKVTCVSTKDSSFSDTIAVAILNLPINLGADTTFCDGESIVLDAGIGGTEYEWSTGNNERTLTVSETGQFWAKISNSEGCIGIDTIKVSIMNAPTATGINATPYGLTYAFDIANQQDVNQYAWQFGDSQNSTDEKPVHTYQTEGEYTVTVKLFNLCDSISLERKITVIKPTSIDDINGSETVIFPNPIQDQLNITISDNLGQTQITIFDIEGKEKSKQNVSTGSTLQLQTANWTPGIYVVRIISESGVEIKRIVKH